MENDTKTERRWRRAAFNSRSNILYKGKQNKQKH